jgi:hypothetical protein
MSIPRDKKYAENIGKAVLVRPSPLYSCALHICTSAPVKPVLDTPYTGTFLNNPKFADKYRKKVMYSSCCLSYTCGPFTAVIDPAGTCPFARNKKLAEKLEKHSCTLLGEICTFSTFSAVLEPCWHLYIPR